MSQLFWERNELFHIFSDKNMNFQKIKQFPKYENLTRFAHLRQMRPFFKHFYNFKTSNLIFEKKYPLLQMKKDFSVVCKNRVMSNVPGEKVKSFE